MRLRIIHLVATACLAATVEWGLTLATLMFYVKAKGGSVTLYSALATSFMAVQLFSALAWGKISDSLGRKRSLLIALAGSALSIYFLAISNSLVDVFIARLFGAVFCGSTTILSTTIAELSQNETRARNLGYVEAGVNCGFFLVGPLLGGKLFEIDPALPYYVGGGIGLLNVLSTFFLFPSRAQGQPALITVSWLSDELLNHGAVLFMVLGTNLILFTGMAIVKDVDSFFLKQLHWLFPGLVGGLNFAAARFAFPWMRWESPQTNLTTSATGKFSAFKQLASSRIFLGGLMLMLGLGLAKAPYEICIALYAKALIGATPNVVGHILTMFGITLMAMQFFAFPRIVRKLGEVKTSLIGLSVGGLGALLLLLFGQGILPQIQPVLLAIMVVDGIGISLVVPSAASLVAKSVSSPKLKGMAMGTFRGANSLGKLTGPVSGMLFDRVSIHAPFVVSLLAWLLGMITTFIWKWESPPASEVPANGGAVATKSDAEAA